MHKTQKLTALAAGGVSVLAVAAPAAAGAATIPSGYYQCYQTTSSVWPPTGARTYSTSFVRSFTLFRNGTYNVLAELSADRYNHWQFAKGQFKFRSGPFWAGFTHLAGTYNRSGKPMPNSTISSTLRYPLVLRDVRAGDSDIVPHHETLDASFWYCKKR